MSIDIYCAQWGGDSERLEALRKKLCSVGLHSAYHDTPEKAADAVCEMIAYYRRELADPSAVVCGLVMQKYGVDGFTVDEPARCRLVSLPITEVAENAELLQKVQQLERENAALLETVEELARQHCHTSTALCDYNGQMAGTLVTDSGALTPDSIALERLADAGRFRIVAAHGRMVVGYWPENDPAAKKEQP